jgi:hypothetical protein
LVVSRRCLTKEEPVRYPVSSSGICERWSGTGSGTSGFLLVSNAPQPKLRLPYKTVNNMCKEAPKEASKMWIRNKNDINVDIDNIFLLFFCLRVQVVAVTVLRAGYNCTVSLGTSNLQPRGHQRRSVFSLLLLKEDDNSYSTVFFGKLVVAHLVNKFSSLMELKCSLSCSKKPHKTTSCNWIIKQPWMFILNTDVIKAVLLKISLLGYYAEPIGKYS